MGRRGPARKPTEDLQKRGSTAAIGRTISAKAQGIPQPSEYLQGEARAVWFDMVADLKLRGHLSPSYSKSLEVFCMLVAQYRAISHAMNEEGLVSRGLRRDPESGEMIEGQYDAHPLLMKHLKVAAELIRYGDRFGWTPASNQTLSDAKSARDDEKENKFFGAVG